MKKIYTAPSCELLGTFTTNILADSVTDQVRMNLDEGLDDTFKGYGGVDDGTHEADANLHVWDHFDRGM
jgi:hypothetical protein